MWEGENDRETLLMWLCRRIATLIRNAHFKDSVSEYDFMPLPWDDEQRSRQQGMDAQAAFMSLAAAMGAEIVREEYSEKSTQ
ncbi:hypothetical protein [Spirosoma profusum]|uniref:hypothetical protein n=1 Tax=Spirosoma profusum TaxID=2771354 RepID=UPI00168884D0|nr:hypothetical protein [Spirosoma profusum]